MVAAPGLWAVGRDVLGCLGLGLLLAAWRDLLDLALGRGALRIFLADVFTFCLAAVLLCGYAAASSASGAARWYMAFGMAGGALGWHWAISPALHRVLGGGLRILAGLAARAKGAALAPLERYRQAAHLRRQARRVQKSSQKVTKTKKVLQNDERILYN